MLQVTFLLIAIVKFGNSVELKPCITIANEGGSNGRNATCVFPFIYKNLERNTCINDNDNDGRFWCSTKTDPDTSKHVGGQGNWGYCQDSCTGKYSM